MDYIPTFLPEDAAEALLLWLQDEAKISWLTERFNIFGREHKAPRTLTWYGDSGLNYRYTGVDHRAHGWPPTLEGVRDRINQQFDLACNFVLINRYQSGSEYMGWHRDNEQQILHTIASLSIGATRRFRYRPIAAGEPKSALGAKAHKRNPSQFLDLQHGSLLVFDGRWPHTLSKTKRCVNTRYNLTFRQISSI